MWFLHSCCTDLKCIIFVQVEKKIGFLFSELDADDTNMYLYLYLILSAVKYDSDDKDGKYNLKAKSKSQSQIPMNNWWIGYRLLIPYWCTAILSLLCKNKIIIHIHKVDVKYIFILNCDINVRKIFPSDNKLFFVTRSEISSKSDLIFGSYNSVQYFTSSVLNDDDS